MAVIEVKNLTKDYKINKKGKGLGGAIKNLFLRKKTRRFSRNAVF